jgi:choline dehydrogenase
MQRMARVGPVGQRPPVAQQRPEESGARVPEAPTTVPAGKGDALEAGEAGAAPVVIEAKPVAAPAVAAPSSKPGALPIIGEYDYVIVGSGAGGAPLAAELARQGYSVCVLEAGEAAQNPQTAVPAFHAIASAAPDAATFWVTQDSKLDPKDPNDAPRADGRGGIEKPRGWTLGGSPQVNAMVTLLPAPQEWQSISDMTGDPDWKPENMQKIWATAVEHNDGHPVLKALDSLGKALHLGGLQNIHGHGFEGWLHVAQPGLGQAATILKDEQLGRIFFETLRQSVQRSGVGNLLHRLGAHLDQNDPRLQHREGFNLTSLATDHGARSDPGDHLKDVQRRAEAGEFKGRIDIKTGTLATKIELDEGDPPRAKGVDVLAGEHLYQADNLYTPLAKGTPARVLAKNEVILSGGTFNSPQLLMLSGIGPKEKLERVGIPVKVERPGVGTGVQDRIEVAVVSQMPKDFSAFDGAKLTLDPRKDPEFKKWLETNHGAYATNGLAVAVAFKSDPKLDHPDVYIFGWPGDFHGYHPGFDKELPEHHDRFTWQVLQAHQHNKAGTLELDSKDPTKQARVDMHQFDEPASQADVEATAKAVEWIRSFTAKAGATAELVPGPKVQTHEQLVQWIKENAWGHHPSGGARMGAKNDPDAVVDSGFNVIGTEGLRVVDASTFETIPGLFPVADLYTRSELAAQKITRLATAEGKVPSGPSSAKPRLWQADRSPTAAERIALTQSIYDAYWGNKNNIPDDGGPGKLWRVSDLAAKLPLVRDLPGVKDWNSPRMEAFTRALASAVTISPAGETIIPPSYRDFYKGLKLTQAALAGYPVEKISEGVASADRIGVVDPVTGARTESSPRLFYQRWDPPDGVAKSGVVIVSPAYQGTGRQWTPIVAELAKQGKTVLVMDNEYAGLSAGQPGRFTGDSLAAGIVLMLSQAEELRQREGLPSGISVLGESLSAGAAWSGVMAAYNGKVELGGRPLPKDEVYLGMVNPYLGKTSMPLVESLSGAAEKIGLPTVAIPTTAAITNVYRDADARKRFNHLAQLEHVKVASTGLIDSADNLQHALEGFESGALKVPPNVKLGILRTTNDQSIDRSQTDRLERLMGSTIRYEQRVDDLPDHALVLNDVMRPNIVKLAGG